MSRFSRTSMRASAALALTLLLGSLAGPASAHVTVNAPGATEGGFTKLTFRVPSEKAEATTKVDVVFPESQPLAYVSIKPHTGWTYVATKTKLPAPIDVEGTQITEAITRVVWTATGEGIKAGEFDEFEVSAGPLPTATSMEFKALQTYAGGEVVSWIESPTAGADEPERPAPVLSLAPVASTTSASPAPSVAAASSSTTTDDEDSNGLAITALILGILGVLLGGAALARAMAGRKTAV